MKEELNNEQLEAVYDVMEKICKREIKRIEGINECLKIDVKGIYKYSSFNFLYGIYRCMIEGKGYKRSFKLNVLKFIIEKIGIKYGIEGLKKALISKN